MLQRANDIKISTTTVDGKTQFTAEIPPEIVEALLISHVTRKIESLVSCVGGIKDLQIERPSTNNPMHVVSGQVIIKVKRS